MATGDGDEAAEVYGSVDPHSFCSDVPACALGVRSEIGYRGSGCDCRVSASKTARGLVPPGIMRIAFEDAFDLTEWLARFDLVGPELSRSTIANETRIRLPHHPQFQRRRLMHDASRRIAAGSGHVGTVARTCNIGRQAALDDRTIARRHGSVGQMQPPVSCGLQQLPTPRTRRQRIGRPVRHLAAPCEECTPNPLPRMGNTPAPTRAVAEPVRAPTILPAHGPVHYAVGVRVAEAGGTVRGSGVVDVGLTARAGHDGAVGGLDAEDGLALGDFPADLVVEVGVAGVEDEEEAGVGAGAGVAAAGGRIERGDAGALDLVAGEDEVAVVAGVGGDCSVRGEEGYQG